MRTTSTPSRGHTPSRLSTRTNAPASSPFQGPYGPLFPVPRRGRQPSRRRHRDGLDDPRGAFGFGARFGTARHQLGSSPRLLRRPPNPPPHHPNPRPQLPHPWHLPAFWSQFHRMRSGNSQRLHVNGGSLADQRVCTLKAVMGWKLSGWRMPRSPGGVTWGDRSSSQWMRYSGKGLRPGQGRYGLIDDRACGAGMEPGCGRRS